MTPILGDELLRGERIYLDRIRRADLPRLAEMWSNVEFMRYLSRREVSLATVEQMEEWYADMNRENATPTFAIRALDGDELVGACGLKDVRWASRHTFFWIGIGERAAQGKGYGSDATRVLLKYAFLDLNLNCVGLEVFSYNERARVMYEKIGFRHDGLLRAYLYRDGTYYDMHLMSMLRDEWEARYGQVARTSRSPT